MDFGLLLTHQFCSKRKMKVRKGTQGNKKKDYQTNDGGNEEIGRKEKDMLRGKEKGNGQLGSSPCQGRRAGFQALRLCAV